MAKMLMGQIDHARNRLRQLVAEKTGKAPSMEKLYTSKDVVEALRKYELSVTPAQLKTAFDAFIDQTSIETTEEFNTGYPDYNKGRKPVKRPPSSVEEGLCTLIYGKANRQRVEDYEKAKKTFEERAAVIKAESERVEDAIVLGDHHAALAALQEFAALEL